MNLGEASDTSGHPTGRTLLPVLAAMPGHLLWRAQARVEAALSEVLPAGVDIHGLATLLALGAGRARSQQEIADAVSTSRTTVARQARALTDQGLVERVRNPNDRRSYLLSRTATGTRTLRRWLAHTDALQERLTAGLSDAERTDLHDLLLAVAAADLADDVPPELVASTGFLVSRVHARLHREFLAALAPIHLEPRHFGSLNALTSLGPVPQAELARTLGISGATTVEIVDALEARGLLERRRDVADRRTQLLHLTDRTAPALAEATAIAETTMAGLLAPLDDDAVARLVVLLRRFVTAP